MIAKVEIMPNAEQNPEKFPRLKMLPKLRIFAKSGHTVLHSQNSMPTVCVLGVFKHVCLACIFPMIHSIWFCLLICCHFSLKRVAKGWLAPFQLGTSNSMTAEHYYSRFFCSFFLLHHSRMNECCLRRATPLFLIVCNPNGLLNLNV